MRRLVPVLVLAFALGLPAEAAADCQDASGVCIDDDSAKWSEGVLSRKARGKAYKKNRKRKKVPVTLTLENGRGSLFIDGRYRRWDEPLELVPGKHDVHVRDGDQVIAQGILQIPRKSVGFNVVFVHP